MAFVCRHKIFGIVALLALFLLQSSNALWAQLSQSYELHKAVKNRNGPKVVDILNSPGGSELINVRDKMGKGDTMLINVLRDRDLLWVRFLVGKGARIDDGDAAGNSPLMVAVMMNYVDAIKLLKDLGADVNATNHAGETALIKAVHNRNSRVARLLLKAGADPDKRDSLQGFSAYDYAKRDRRLKILSKQIEKHRNRKNMPQPTSTDLTEASKAQTNPKDGTNNN